LGIKYERFCFGGKKMKLTKEEEKYDALTYLAYLQATPKSQRDYGYEEEVKKVKKRLKECELKQ